MFDEENIKFFNISKDNLEISDVIVLTEENSIGLRFKDLKN